MTSADVLIIGLTIVNFPQTIFIVATFLFFAFFPSSTKTSVDD